MKATLCCFLWFWFVTHLAGAYAIEIDDLVAKVNFLEASGYELSPALISEINLLRERSDTSGDSLDHYDKWIEWIEENPEKLGVSDFSNEPLVAGNTANITQVFRLGSDISPGGGILVAKHWQNPVEFQTINSARKNFIRVSVNRPTVEIGRAAISRSGIYGGLDKELPLPFFPVILGELYEGDEISIEYRNLELPRKATSAFKLPLLFKTDSDSGLFLAPVENLKVYAGSAAKLDVLVQTRVNPGEEIIPTLHVRDEFGNTAYGRSPSLEVLVNGIFHSRIPASDENHHELQAIRFESKGDHRIDIKSSGGGLSGKSNPFVVQYSEQKIYWGDLHVHTNLGEGNADPEYLADLDFIVPAVHTRYLTGDNWTGISRPKAWLWGDSLKTGGYHLAITDAEPVPVNYQRELMRQLKVEDNLLVALADIPADDRYLDNQLTRLVEIVAGDSHFEWYANRLMAQGYRLGFTASSHSHLLPLSDTRQNALTAVIVNEGESYLDALKQGRTYITTGERIYLDVNVNGADPGSRIEMADRRTISGKVKGTGAIDKIELIKNGQVIDSVDVAGDRDSHTLKVSFYSASEPAKSQRDLPRNGREWIGYLRAGDSPIVDISAPGFRNASRQAIALNPNEENRLDFITWTRGNRSSFLVDVNTEDEDLVFELNLSGGHEDIDIVPLTRPASPIPLSRQMVSLFSLKEETIVRTVSVNGYSDKVSFELVDRKADDEIEFEFRDRSPPRQGDYYYVRVLQLDDQMAWSSPVFVGGYDHP